jgi:acyl-coenzyme A thioesterase PaaI-like protein
MARLVDLNAGVLPFAKLLGMTFIAAEPDRVTAELMVRDHLCTRPAVLHGGAIIAFSDSFGAVGTASGSRRQKSSLLS